MIIRKLFDKSGLKSSTHRPCFHNETREKRRSRRGRRSGLFNPPPRFSDWMQKKRLTMGLYAHYLLKNHSFYLRIVLFGDESDTTELATLHFSKSLPSRYRSRILVGQPPFSPSTSKLPSCLSIARIHEDRLDYIEMTRSVRLR